MTIRQSFCWWCFTGRGVPDLELLQTAKALGYEAVEQLGEELFQPARDLGFVIAAQSGHQSIDRGWNHPGEHPRLESEIHASLALAQKYQIPNLIVFSGNRSACPSDEAGLDNTALGLARIAPAAEAAGVTLTLELLNSKRDHRGYQCDLTAWGAEVCRRVPSPRVKLLYDIYHMQVMEGDIISTLEANYREIGHYHTAGVPGRHDLDESQELNYPPIMRAIAKTGYTGFVGHEFVPKGDPIAALESAFRLCDV